MKNLFTSFKDNCGFGLLASLNNTPSHKNLEDAMTALERMMHRGAVAADGKSGDGSGLLVSIPHKFMQKEAKKQGVELPEQYAVAMVFNKDEKDFEIFEKYCDDNDLKIIMKREVPIDTSALGEYALNKLPKITQIFVTPNSIMSYTRFNAMLYLTRKEIEHALKDKKEFYIASFSNSTISYKGLVMPKYIKEFYIDLKDKDFEISFALFHQRFSTNTLPEWKLAQPFRTIAHNGEINSVTANRFNVSIKRSSMKSEIFTDSELDRISTIIQEDMSDSASLDNFLEFLLANGKDFFKTVRSLLPAPWHNRPHMDSELRAFYEYSSALFEPWDGPAAVSVTNGKFIGCVIDRNGLRPAKYIITKDKRIIISSEYGVLDTPDEDIIERGRLSSSEMMAIHLKTGKIYKDSQINDYIKKNVPYGKWLNTNMKYLQEFEYEGDIESIDSKELKEKQRYFNYTLELMREVIRPMIKEGKETTAAMGDDTPLAAFSKEQRNFSDFFKQKFAQVTNPPIDPIREKSVMSLNTGFGEVINVLKESEEHTKRIKTTLPIMSQERLKLLLEFGEENSPKYDPAYKAKSYNTTFENDLQNSLYKLVDDIIKDVRDNNIRTILLDDRGIDKNHKVIPMLMVLGRLNQKLVDAKLRHLVSIIPITAEVFDPHTASLMLAYGATAIHPYLLFYTIEELYQGDEDIKAVLKKSRRAISAGILKIMSKMGISTLASYRHSKLFDIIGLSQQIIDDCFNGSVGLLCGLDYQDIEERLNSNHARAFTDAFKGKPKALYKGGFYKYKKGEEFHDFSRDTINAIQESASTGTKEAYEKLKELVNKRDKKFIRDFFELKSDREAIPIEQVEPIGSIFQRFSTAAMSMGSISQEAHEVLAKAMNELKAKSNSGEGGEAKERLHNKDLNSKIKQVASGRFGVTPEYLRSAEEIQIKIAQGAKPGEGGQLPGTKVTPLIAKLRYTKTGVTLISPPPHHDIYSIEDLAQLIFDMKQVNPNAKVAVKLVSTSGVGTIAAGVAKCYADKIIISGGDGGTGAAPIGSIRFAGNPWELGLVEAHNALKANGLRKQVVLETDGGLKTGLDIVKAAIFGAEEYAFGTSALVTVGCRMFRVCHLNTCGVGVATQDEALRKRFSGNVEKVKNYFTLVAQEVREILAELGYSSLKEIIGKNHLLKVIDDEFAKKFSFEKLLYKIEGDDTCQVDSNEPFDKNEFEKALLQELLPNIKNKTPIQKEIEIKNQNRSFGTLISGEIAKYYGDAGLPKDTITLKLSGKAGQSLGAFLTEGVNIKLTGAGNDYVGKGMSGGSICITSPLENASLAGNTCLYGATGGRLYVTGIVGERFAVRNSGANAVVEGTGDHPCEYMTGGTVIILGKTGTNFGAGMTGGLAFVYDEENNFFEKVNRELVEAVRIDTDDRDQEMYIMKRLLKKYYNETKSKKAEKILNNFRLEISKFWMVAPKNIKATLIVDKKGE